jgi:hypothetical protein
LPLGAAPADWGALDSWLAQAWDDRRDPAEVRAALLAAGWLGDQAGWRNLELTGDLRDEWVLQLRDFAAVTADVYQPISGPPGNLWIVGDSGIVYAHHTGVDALSREPGLMPEVAAVGDMTGDGLPELVLQDTDCGAHTCYGYFSVVGYTPEGFANLVDPEAAYGGMISISYPDVRLVREDGVDVLYVHGGTIGSAGAGIVRGYTDIWAWESGAGDSGAVRWCEGIWDYSGYRHHLLYEAMELMDKGDLARAEELLTAVLENPDLIVEPFGDATREETEAAIAQFAGFRLVLTHLLRGDRLEAGRRAGWLLNAYPGAPLALAARHAVDGWIGRTGLHTLCERLQADLATVESPTGPLEDMGYGNPSITTAQLCTW